MANEESGDVDANSCSSVALGNSEDETRDNSKDSDQAARCPQFFKWKGKKRIEKKVHFHSLNTQGLEGAWKMLHLATNKNFENVDVLLLQEVSANDTQWKGMQRYMRRFGFRGFYTPGCIEGKNKKNGLRHRGVATFFKDYFPLKWHFEESWAGGQFHAIELYGTLVINSYCSPSEGCVQEHHCRLSNFFTQTGWTGEWLAGGDWNEVFDGSWASTLALMQGGWQCETDLVESTRWSGSRTIDFFMGTVEMSPMTTCYERLSDHKIVRTEVDMLCEKIEEELHFKKDPIFEKPNWLTAPQWQKLIEESCKEGVHSQWKEACHMAMQVVADDDENIDEQGIVDFTWTVTCAQLSWILRMSCVAALHCIPFGFDDVEEIKKIQQLANYNRIKGATVALMERRRNKLKHVENEAIRRKWKEHGRLSSLMNQMNKGCFDKEGRGTSMKHFGEIPESLSRGVVYRELNKIKNEIDKRQRNLQTERLKSWRKRMKNITMKSDWLNRKGFMATPSLADESGEACNKVESAKKLWNYWSNFWQDNAWNEEEIQQKEEELVGLLSASLRGQVESRGRPNIALFRARIKTVKGCQGADGWTKDEISFISKSPIASQLVWDSMAVWEEYETSPTAVANCKMVMIAKKDERCITPAQYRPIAVQSSWWRAWSSTWLRSKCISSWVSATFTKNISGGIPGSMGPETMATVIDYFLSQWKHGVSLDLRHAFDTVHLGLLERVLTRVLPESNRRWISLAFGHWKKMKRWIILDSHVCGEPLCPEAGLPQGDPLSPLMLVVLMLALQEKVKLKMGDVPFQHFTYMDDRTIITKSKDAVALVQTSWQEVASEYHLLENPGKAQVVDLSSKKDSFEVLGAVLGNPKPDQEKKSKAFKRLDKTSILYRKIRFLPESFDKRMKDSNIFGKNMLAYGWISHAPMTKWTRTQQTEIWRSLGKTQYSSVPMRKVIAGASLHINIVVLMRQLRLLAKRNAELASLYSLDIWSLEFTSLEEMVVRGLIDLNWSRSDRTAKWEHPLFEEGFELAEVNDRLKWKKISHAIRESYRQNSFEELKMSDRHELVNNDIGHYDPSRRDAALRWARCDTRAYMLILGAIQSPFQRRMHDRRFHSVCPRCSLENPSWDHMWMCFAQVVPADTLLRRYCWPKTVADQALCTAFLDGICSMSM